MAEELCSMCEQEPATTSYGYPVCRACRLWLIGTIQPALDDLEASQYAAPEASDG